MPFDARRSLGFTEYDKRSYLPYLFGLIDIKNHLGAVVSAAGLTQLRTSETEKYPHVTYFLNGGVETVLPGEERVMVPSPRDVKTYDLKPEMSARGVTDGVVKALESGLYDLIVVNLANCDMVGHTGVFEATRMAVEAVDLCLGRLLPVIKELGGILLITADHGNADEMYELDKKGQAKIENGKPKAKTSHTLNPVPFIIYDPQFNGEWRLDTTVAKPGLANVAATVLTLLGYVPPADYERSMVTL